MKTTTLLLAALAGSALAQDADLSKKLSNPVSDLISVPFQGNLDFGNGPADGQKFTLNIQPVIPISINEDWNLISRTILPVIDQEGTRFGGVGDAFGLGDTVQSYFFSPKESDPIWGVGPVLLFPTATDAFLGGDKWGAGPTGVVLKQTGPWTYGALANHLWDYAGSGSNQVNATFVQPFVAYNAPGGWTFTANSESTYDWANNQWTVPVNLIVSKLQTFGNQPVQFFGGARYYIEKPDQGPEWGLRFGVTFLFPK